MITSLWKKYGWVLLTVFVLVFVDQISKLKIEDWLLAAPSYRVVVIPDFFNFRLAYNTGGGWSILDDAPWLLLLSSTVMIVGLSYYFTKVSRSWTKIAIVVIIGGALGNWIDRVAYQHVIDFLQFFPFGYAFPIFNFADICITLGTIALLADTLLEPKEVSHE